MSKTKGKTCPSSSTLLFPGILAKHSEDRDGIMRSEQVMKTSINQWRFDSSSLPSEISSEVMAEAYRSVLRQIDWNEVAQDVMKQEASIIDQAVLQNVIRTQIEGILTEACNETLLGGANEIHSQEAGEIDDANDADIDTEDDEDGGDEESYEHSFVESDDSKTWSSEYWDSDYRSDVSEGQRNYNAICDICGNFLKDRDATMQM